MKFSVKATQPEKQKKTCLIIGIFENNELTSTAKVVDKASHGYISKLIKQGSFKGKIGTTLPLYHLADSGFEHILLVGCGKCQVT